MKKLIIAAATILPLAISVGQTFPAMAQNSEACSPVTLATSASGCGEVFNTNASTNADVPNSPPTITTDGGYIGNRNGAGYSGYSEPGSEGPNTSIYDPYEEIRELREANRRANLERIKAGDRPIESEHWVTDLIGGGVYGVVRGGFTQGAKTMGDGIVRKVLNP